MKTLWDEVAALEGKASKGDVKAGISAILKLLSVGSVAFLALKVIVVGLVTFVPWVVPFISPAVLMQIVATVVRSYAELPQDERRIIAAAIGWLNGRISVHD